MVIKITDILRILVSFDHVIPGNDIKCVIYAVRLLSQLWLSDIALMYNVVSKTFEFSKPFFSSNAESH